MSTKKIWCLLCWGEMIRTWYVRIKVAIWKIFLNKLILYLQKNCEIVELPYTHHTHIVLLLVSYISMIKLSQLMKPYWQLLTKVNTLFQFPQFLPNVFILSVLGSNSGHHVPLSHNVSVGSFWLTVHFLVFGDFKSFKEY